MRLLLVTTIVIMAVFTLVASAARILSQQSPTPAHIAAMLPDSDCTAPCWNSIRPSRFNGEQMEQQILTFPAAHIIETNNEWEFSVDGQYTQRAQYFIHLYLYPNGLRLGDVVAALGLPDYVSAEGLVYIGNEQHGRPLRLYYEDEQVILQVSLYKAERLSMEQPVTLITYPSNYFARSAGARDWSGFVRTYDLIASRGF